MSHPPLLTVQRYLRGSGHEWGGLYTEITNHHSSSEIKLLYLDMIPWFCRIYIHTLTVKNGTLLDSSVCTCMWLYRMAGKFHGVLIFVIDSAVTNISLYENLWQLLVCAHTQVLCTWFDSAVTKISLYETSLHTHASTKGSAMKIKTPKITSGAFFRVSLAI